MNVEVKLASGTSPGPYSIYYDSVAPANLLASGVSYASLAAGVTYTVPNTTTSIVVINTRAACAGNSTIVQTQPITPQPTFTPSCTLAGTAKLAASSCTFAGTAVLVTPPCVRPSGLATYTFNSQLSINSGVSFTPFTSSQVNACNASYNEVVDNGYVPTYTGLTGQVSNLAVGQTVYLGQNVTNCDKIPDGFYLTDAVAGQVTEVVGGVIQSITICPYTPPPPPPPVLPKLSWDVERTSSPFRVEIKDLSAGGGTTLANLTSTAVGNANMTVGHNYQITLTWLGGSGNQIRMRVCNTTTSSELYYTTPPVSITNPTATYTFTATTNNIKVYAVDGGAIPPTCI